MAPAGVRIEPVGGPRELDEVIRFPFSLYRHDPLWVPPLISERRQHYDPKHNPFFQHADMQLFRAVRDGEIVGTIAAIDDELHCEIWDESVGFFGVFESIDDDEVAGALLASARSWLADRGRVTMRGPMNLNINDECGLLIEGFDGSPVIMMPYNPPYYQPLLENQGLVKVKDLYAYDLDLHSYGHDLENMPERVTRVARLAKKRYGVVHRNVDLGRLREEVGLLKPIYRQAWSKNWGAVPLSDAEFDYLASRLRHVVDPDLSFLAFVDGRAVGCFLVLADFCQVAKHLNGRLFPTGWAKFLWHRRRITGVRVLIMGVLEEYRLKGIEALFYIEAIRTALRKGYRQAEISWTLEDNFEINRAVEMMGGVRYRTYRLYDTPTTDVTPSKVCG